VKLTDSLFDLVLSSYLALCDLVRDSLEMEILTVWKGKFSQFEKENFDRLEMEILKIKINNTKSPSPLSESMDLYRIAK
jgi:hypothetical protein